MEGSMHYRIVVKNQRTAKELRQIVLPRASFYAASPWERVGDDGVGRVHTFPIQPLLDVVAIVMGRPGRNNEQVMVDRKLVPDVLGVLVEWGKGKVIDGLAGCR